MELSHCLIFAVEKGRLPVYPKAESRLLGIGTKKEGYLLSVSGVDYYLVYVENYIYT